MYNLFLDDFRRPEDAFNYMGLPIYNLEDWVVVKNYYAFISVIQGKGVPEVISFDHDLDDEIEIWKDVVGYEGIYIVSNLGRVERIKICKGTAGGILTPIKNESGLYVKLRNNGNDKSFKIHRLVLEAFEGINHDKPQVNHKDGNRWNNNLDNLEWCSQSENIKHSHNELEREFTAYAENHANSETVSQYNKNGELIDVYGSVNEAARQLGIDYSNIAKGARGERKTVGGFIWKYENLEPTIRPKITHIDKKDKNYSDRFFIPEVKVEKTGYHCAKWLIDYCLDNNEELPKRVIVHSMNPYGSRNIKSLFDTYYKVFNKEPQDIPLNPSFRF